MSRGWSLVCLSIVATGGLGACGGKTLCEERGGPFKGEIPAGPAQEITALLPKGAVLCSIHGGKETRLAVEAPDRATAKEIPVAIAKAGYASTGPVGDKPDDANHFTFGLEKRDGASGVRVLAMGSEVGGLWDVDLVIKTW